MTSAEMARLSPAELRKLADAHMACFRARSFQARDAVGAFADMTRSVVQSRPLITMGAIAAGGFLLARFLSRNRSKAKSGPGFIQLLGCHMIESGGRTCANVLTDWIAAQKADKPPLREARKARQ